MRLSHIGTSLAVVACLLFASSAMGSGEPLEACCLDSGCENLEPSVCDTLDGSPQGPGTICLDIQSCCLPDGSCSMKEYFCCLAEGGTPRGPGSVCGGFGACTFADGTCNDQDRSCCEDSGGVPGGPGSTCEPPAIPTVSEWGIAAMALLLLVGAKVYFSRRRAMQA